MLALCEGLIQNHVSDGSRYNMPAKRRAELSHQFRYTSDNPCYSYSRGAVRNLVPNLEVALQSGVHLGAVDHRVLARAVGHLLNFKSFAGYFAPSTAMSRSLMSFAHLASSLRMKSSNCSGLVLAGDAGAPAVGLSAQRWRASIAEP